MNFKSIRQKSRIYSPPDYGQSLRGKLLSRWLILSLLLLALFPLGPAIADEYHPHSDIYQQVKSFLLAQNSGHSENIEVQIGRIDPRLRLKRCAQPLEVFLPQGSRDSGRTIVGVKCAGPKAWTIYVQADVKKSIEVYISTSPISRGTLITESHIQLQLMDSSKLRFGYITDKDKIIGMVAGRRIAADTVITPRMLDAPKLVKRGEKVQIIAEVDGIVVRVEGEALEDGAKGDMIRVRNNSSKKIIEAIVIAPGKVKVRI